MRKTIITITTLLILLFLILLRSNYKSKHIKSLQDRLGNQELYIEKIYTETNYQNVESLYMEIMDLGAKLDSMQLIYD